jgi:hypothetical protein
MRRVRLPRPLDLRHLSEVDLEVARPNQGVAYMTCAGDRHEAVAASPDEERIGREATQRRPGVLLAQAVDDRFDDLLIVSMKEA